MKCGFNLIASPSGTSESSAGKAIPSAVENYVLNPWDSKNYLNHGAPVF